MTITINKKRFLNTFTKSSSIGTTKNGGLHRLALSEKDKEIREVFVKWLREAGLTVRIDDFGNIYGRREGKLKNVPAVAMGSHLDTQPTGGRFDGVLGVLSALEVIRVLNDEKIETDYPIEIINFTNEEGARFRPPMLGSGGVAGVFEKDFVYQSTDDNGITYETALKEIGYQGEKIKRIQSAKNFIELHIEQGPILDKQNKDIGIVGGIQGMSWLNVEVTGETNHAGPTPMDTRKDALVAASAMILEANELPKRFQGLLTTVGKVDNHPNIVNVIPGDTSFKLDIRHPQDEVRNEAIAFYKNKIEALTTQYKVKVSIGCDWDSPTVNFNKEVKQTISDSSKDLGYSTHHLFSGPGHDAKYMSKIAKTGMIFVKSIGGVSHNEEEFTHDEDLLKGANVLLSVILRLANNEETG